MLLTFCSSTSSSSFSFCGDSTFVCCICFLRVVAVNEFPMAWHKIIHKYWDFSIGTQATHKSLNTHTHKLTPIDQSDSSNSRDFNLKWFFFLLCRRRRCRRWFSHASCHFFCMAPFLDHIWVSGILMSYMLIQYWERTWINHIEHVLSSGRVYPTRIAISNAISVYQQQ